VERSARRIIGGMGRRSHQSIDVRFLTNSPAVLASFLAPFETGYRFSNNPIGFGIRGKIPGIFRNAVFDDPAGFRNPVA
jgi:hypothetical protein